MYSACFELFPLLFTSRHFICLIDIGRSILQPSRIKASSLHAALTRKGTHSNSSRAVHVRQLIKHLSLMHCVCGVQILSKVYMHKLEEILKHPPLKSHDSPKSAISEGSPTEVPEKVDTTICRCSLCDTLFARRHRPLLACNYSQVLVSRRGEAVTRHRIDKKWKLEKVWLWLSFRNLGTFCSVYSVSTKALRKL